MRTRHVITLYVRILPIPFLLFVNIYRRNSFVTLYIYFCRAFHYMQTSAIWDGMRFLVQTGGRGSTLKYAEGSNRFSPQRKCVCVCVFSPCIRIYICISLCHTFRIWNSVNSALFKCWQIQKGKKTSDMRVICIQIRPSGTLFVRNL